VSSKGSEVIIDSLRKQGVEHVFGYPGGSVIPLFDSLYDVKDLKLFLVRHEQAAAHAADGYARATGRVGVCVATSGPGATNLVTGIATAHMDSIPLVAITGQVKVPLIGNDAFQEADITGITRPITKHNYLIKDVADLPRIIKEAFHIASTGRPGPVVVDIPVDITLAEFKGEIDLPIDLPGYNPSVKGNVKQLKRVAKALAEAERPLIYAGGGVILAGASDQVRELAKKCDVPVTTTLMGLGVYPETDEKLSLGMLGMHGTAYANYAVMNADLIIAVGARFDDRVTGRVDAFAPYAKIVHLDVDPTAISKNIEVDIPVVGDAKHILDGLLELVKQKKHPEWIEQIAKWRRDHPLSYADGGLKPQFVVEKIYEVTGGDAIICTEVGQNQMWAAQFYKYTKPRTFISSGGLGTMGYGFPAAIGAQVGCPDRTVVDIAGDGSIQMNIQELCTAVQHELPVKIAILNNGFLGMVRQWQELFWNRRYAHTTLDCQPDFVKLAEAYGAVGMRAEDPDEVEPTLREAIGNGRPTLIDVRVEPEENVFPMVPAGGKIDEMIGPKEPELL